MKKDKKEKKVKVKGAKERRFPKFHILDAVIIILVIAIIAGVYFRYSVVDMLGNLKNQSDANVTFLVENIKDTTELYIKIDDAVYFKADGNKFGTVMEIAENSDRPLNITPASETFFVKDGVTENGTSITVNYPSETRINAEGKIRCKGVFAPDGSFMLNGSTYLCAGQKYVVCTEKVTLEITVIGVEKP